MSKHWHSKENPLNNFCDQISDSRDNTSNPKFVLSDFGLQLLSHVIEKEINGSSDHDAYETWQFLRAVLGYQSEFGRTEITVWKRAEPESALFEVVRGIARKKSYVAVFHEPRTAEILEQAGTFFRRDRPRGYINLHENTWMQRGQNATRVYTDVIDRLSISRKSKRTTVFVKT